MSTSAPQKSLLRCYRHYISSTRSRRTNFNPQWLRYSSTTPESAQSKDTIVFSGIQPTGIPHLGNYLGALRAWVDLQNTSSPDTKLIYSIVDLHALTLPKDAAELRQWRKESLAVLLAIGIKPERATLFYQSDVRAGAFRADVDFKRKLINGIFIPDDTMEAPAKRVMSLKNPKKKMSKSDVDNRSRILVTDTPIEIHHKIRLALTDPGSSITYDPEKRPGVSNLLEMFSHAEAIKAGPSGSGRTPSEIALEYESTSFKAFKQDLAAKLIEMLSSIRERYVEIMEEDAKVTLSGSSDKESYLGMVARKGAEEASANAEITMKQVRTAIGLS
ncbi:Tryptophan--tRNA ligase, mitochondrial [Microsporum canis]